MKYAYPLGLLLGAYLLYDKEIHHTKVLFLYWLVLLALLGFIVESCDAPAFKAWLDRIF